LQETLVVDWRVRLGGVGRRRHAIGCRLRRRHAIGRLRLGGRDSRLQDIEATGGARLLPLEPRAQAQRVEEMGAGKLLQASSGEHLLPANDADIVPIGQLLFRHVRVEGVHVVDGAAGLDDVLHALAERFDSEVHGPDDVEREGVHVEHYHQEANVQQRLDEANEQLHVQQVHGLVLPGIGAAKVVAMTNILGGHAQHNRYQDGVFEPEHQLH